MDIQKSLSSRMQYNLWFLLLGLLAVPFIPFRFIRLPQMISYLNSLKNSPASNTATMMGETTGANLTENENWMNNFALSVSSVIPSRAGYIFFCIWIVGIIAMIILIIKSLFHLRSLQESALPLQNPKVRKLYYRCLDEVEISKKNFYL